MSFFHQSIKSQYICDLLSCLLGVVSVYIDKLYWFSTSLSSHSCFLTRWRDVILKIELIPLCPSLKIPRVWRSGEIVTSQSWGAPYEVNICEQGHLRWPVCLIPADRFTWCQQTAVSQISSRSTCMSHAFNTDGRGRDIQSLFEWFWTEFYNIVKMWPFFEQDNRSSHLIVCSLYRS